MEWQDRQATIYPPVLTKTDDLDKSLLLFITHTCTDLGIKVPCKPATDVENVSKADSIDAEVAKRMGAGFSEGAIQQHIAKLRVKMATLKVAPVPGPSKRGQITSRPSTVYAMRTRGPAPPAPPAISKARSRRKASNVQGEVAAAEATAQDGTVGKPRGKRRAAARKIKRSGSDPADSDAEFAVDNDDEWVNTEINNNGKRARRTGRTNKANAGRKVSKSQAIVDTLQEADRQYEDQVGTDPDAEWIQNASFFGEPSGQDGMSQSFFGGTHFEDDEEEEEEDLGQVARAAAVENAHVNSGFNFFGDAQNLSFPLEEQVSPTSTAHLFTQTYNTPEASGFGGFHDFHLPMSTMNTSGQSPFLAPGPSPALPESTTTTMPGTVESYNSTRNPSMISRTSSQAGIPHGTGFDGNASQPTSPYGLQQPSFNYAIDASAFGFVDPMMDQDGSLNWPDMANVFGNGLEGTLPQMEATSMA
ncbi:hypothetical protein LTS08_004702 [Lithohypha guttulata]|nr:hypothetical protein LTS08_004702 [Lithohypha guttulata]